MKSPVLIAPNLTLVRLGALSVLASKNIKLKEVEKFELKPYTRSARKSSVAEQHKSAITDHVVLTNHNAAKVIDFESDKTTRWVKEAIWIRRKGKNTLNKDKGGGHTNWATSLINFSTPRPQRQLSAATKGRCWVDKIASLKKLLVWQWNVTKIVSKSLIYLDLIKWILPNY